MFSQLEYNQVIHPTQQQQKKKQQKKTSSFYVFFFFSYRLWRGFNNNLTQKKKEKIIFFGGPFLHFSFNGTSATLIRCDVTHDENPPLPNAANNSCSLPT